MSTTDIHNPSTSHLPTRVLALDGLRGVACLMVMISHMYSEIPGGFLGVDLFFVLSGFLITRLLLQEFEKQGSIDLPSFYIRRCFRLLPALLVWLAVTIIFSAVVLSWKDCVESCQDALIVLTAQANRSDVYGASPLRFVGHAWSLSVEDKFYVSWPFLLCALLTQKKVSRSTIVSCVIVTIIGCVLLRARIYHSTSPAPFAFLYRDFASRSDGLLMGCLGAMLTEWGMISSSASTRRVLYGSSLVTIAALGFSIWQMKHQFACLYYGGFTLVAFGTLILILTIIHSPRCILARILENPFLCWTGRLSYGLYLWQIPLMMFGVMYYPRLSGGKVLMGGPLSYAFRPTIAVMTYIVAILSFFLIERPLLRFGAAFVSRRSTWQSEKTELDPLSRWRWLTSRQLKVAFCIVSMISVSGIAWRGVSSYLKEEESHVIEDIDHLFADDGESQTSPPISSGSKVSGVPGSDPLNHPLPSPISKVELNTEFRPSVADAPDRNEPFSITGIELTGELETEDPNDRRELPKQYSGKPQNTDQFPIIQTKGKPR